MLRSNGTVPIGDGCTKKMREKGSLTVTQTTRTLSVRRRQRTSVIMSGLPRVPLCASQTASQSSEARVLYRSRTNSLVVIFTRLRTARLQHLVAFYGRLIPRLHMKQT